MAEEEIKKYDLFDYTEAQLLDDKSLTHYEVLSLSPYCSNDQVKKAYRKASLKYHPDKTGRGEDDYVFLAVKHAYDVLYDDEKRQAYDSTVLPFDDAIPPPRAQMMADPMILYKDEDFYQTFGPVFQRNLRFDAKLRPDANKNKKNKNNNSNKKKNGTNNKHTPPSLGDEKTPVEEVHAFYEYWIHFDSWRDFSAQAADELQVENELENAESRFEKRWIQREIDKRAKQLKTKENGRIQTLVERAMEADPRLRAERQAALEARERAKREREAAKERASREAAEAEKRAEEEAAAEQERAAVARAERELQKKQLRKARQALRKQTSANYDEAEVVWDDAYDLGVDVDVLCQNLELNEIRDLTDELSSLDAAAALKRVHERVAQERESGGKDKAASGESSTTTAETSASTTTNGSANAAGTNSTEGSSGPAAWTKDELSALAKGVKKYPSGGGNRWDQIALYVNNVCQQSEPRRKEECIAKYNEVARPASSVSSMSPAKAEAPSESESPQPAAKAPSTSNASDDTVTDWTAEQDQLLQKALATYPASMDKNERWSSIAASVPGKSKKDCVQRFKTIREALKKS